MERRKEGEGRKERKKGVKERDIREGNKIYLSIQKGGMM